MNDIENKTWYDEDKKIFHCCINGSECISTDGIYWRRNIEKKLTDVTVHEGQCLNVEGTKELNEKGCVNVKYEYGKYGKKKSKRWFWLILEILILVGIPVWIYFSPSESFEDYFCRGILGFVALYSIESLRRYFEDMDFEDM